MNKKKYFEGLNQEIFNFFNSQENLGKFLGQPKNLSIYDVQHIIMRYMGSFNGVDRYAITSRLKNYLNTSKHRIKN